MTQNLFTLKGRLIVVTGGLGQLGMAFTTALVNAGADVAVFDLALPESKARNDRISYHTVDITDRAAIEAAVLELIYQGHDRKYWTIEGIDRNSHKLDVKEENDIEENEEENE